MKQIKTVICPIENASEFDKAINNLLQKQWELKKRTTIAVKGYPNEVGSCAIIQGLYAELERQELPFPEEVTL